MRRQKKPQHNPLTTTDQIGVTKKMKHETNLKSAIDRSVSHDEIVRCRVTCLANGLRAVSEIADVEDSVEIDDMSSDRRLVDVWGTTWDGERFRLYLYADERNP